MYIYVCAYVYIYTYIYIYILRCAIYFFLCSPRLFLTYKAYLPERSSARFMLLTWTHFLFQASVNFFQKAKSSAETPLFLPGHRFSPAVAGKSLHFSLFQRCLRWRPVPGQVHVQAPRNASLWSISCLRVLQSEHPSLPLRPRVFQFLRSVAANFVWPRFPQTRQVYLVVSFGE